jgi:hypothetical protein
MFKSEPRASRSATYSITLVGFGAAGTPYNFIISISPTVLLAVVLLVVVFLVVVFLGVVSVAVALLAAICLVYFLFLVIDQWLAFGVQTIYRICCASMARFVARHGANT